MAATTERFLRTLFSGTLGFVTLTTYKRSWFFPTSEEGLAQAAAHATAIGAKENLYFGCASRKRPLPGAEYGTKDECLRAKAVWADIDFGSVGHASKKCPPTYEDARALVGEAELPTPTFVVNSGGGLHVYWVLLDAVPASQIEPLNKIVQGRIRSAAETHGWHTDMHANWAGVLRVPGSFNHKKETRRSVALVEESEIVYTPESFTGFVTASDAPNGQPPGTDVLSSLGSDGQGVSEAIRKPVPSGPTMPLAEIRKRLQAIKNPEVRERVDRLLGGKTFAPGSRNTDMQRLTGLVVSIAPFNTPDDLLRLFAESVQAMQEEDTDAPDLHLVRDMLERNQEKTLTTLAQDIALSESFVTKNNFDGTLLRERPSYTEAELDAFSKKLGVTRAELDRRWVIKGKKIHFFLVDGKYAPKPVGPEDLAVQMRLQLKPAPITWSKLVGGNVVDRTPEEIMAKHATVFTHLVADLSLQEHRFDGATQTFHEAVCPLRKIEPRYDEKVDAWLRAIGGEKQEKLLDWLASVTRLDHQACALYIAGTASIGKSLLAKAIAQNWSETGIATELGATIGNFNADLARCPFVFADEEVAKKSNGQTLTSAEIRRILGNRGRTLTRKYMPNADLVGNLRLYFAANNDKMLQELGNEEASADDIKAVQLRFLYIDARELKGKCAVDMLAELRATGELKKWADEGTYIAQHIAWLRENRQVVPGTRFLVEGDDPKVADKLTGYTQTVKYVLEWIISHLVRDRSIRISGDPLDRMVRVGNGEILIKTFAIAGDNWDRYLKSYRPARISDIGKALGTLSRRQVRDVDNTRWHVLEVQKIYDWCEEAGLANSKDLRAIIEQPLVLGAQGTVLNFPAPTPATTPAAEKKDATSFSFEDDNGSA